MALAILSAASLPLLKAKKGPEPDIPEPKAPFFHCCFFNQIKTGN
jgi:hypothetical protein